MYSNRTRGPDRFHLTHHVLARLRDRTCFSVAQVAGAVYFGAGKVHPQQKQRVQELLDRYVVAGILERDDQIAACPLYRHRDGTAGRVDRETLQHFEAHAWRRWSPSHDVYLKLIVHDLDRLLPKHMDPCRFTASGAVLPRGAVSRSRHRAGRSRPGPR